MGRYFLLTVYMFNTAFGFILVFVVSIAGAIKGKTAVIELFKAYGILRQRILFGSVGADGMFYTTRIES